MLEENMQKLNKMLIDKIKNDILRKSKRYNDILKDCTTIKFYNNYENKVDYLKETLSIMLKNKKKMREIEKELMFKTLLFFGYIDIGNYYNTKQYLYNHIRKTKVKYLILKYNNLEYSQDILSRWEARKLKRIMSNKETKKRKRL